MAKDEGTRCASQRPSSEPSKQNAPDQNSGPGDPTTSRSESVDPLKTPGTGALPEPQPGGDVDPGSG